MKPLWDDVNARSRGLRTHLLGDDRLTELGSAATLDQLVSRLEQSHLLLDGDQRTAALVEQGLRRDTGRKLALLARWCGSRTAVLRIVFEAEDLRSLRALLRGLVAGVAAETRLEGLIPTPALPLRALTEVARLQDIRAIGALLAAWGSPYATVVSRQNQGMVDLFQLELELTREFLTRSLAASRGGDDYLRRYTRLVVDLENVRSALVLASETHERPPEYCFIEGGDRLTLGQYRKAASAGTATAVRLLASAFQRTPIGAALRALTDPPEIEDVMLTVLREDARSAARRSPLSSAPTLYYALSLRHELIRLQRLVWGIALGAPAGALAR